MTSLFGYGFRLWVLKFNSFVLSFVFVVCCGWLGNWNVYMMQITSSSLASIDSLEDLVIVCPWRVIPGFSLRMFALWLT